jgi:hypothetical protein
MLHAAWLDGGKGRPGYRIMYRRGVQNSASGAVTWEASTPINDGSAEGWGSYVGIEASDNAIHFVWSTAGTARYRRLIRSGTSWQFEPIRDTRASGSSLDNGPDIAVRGDLEIHILTPTGNYAVSKDGGLTWTQDKLPTPAGRRLKNPSMALDSLGNAHFSFIGQIRNAENWSESKPNRGYWELRYVRRETGAAPAWQASHGRGHRRGRTRRIPAHDARARSGRVPRVHVRIRRRIMRQSTTALQPGRLLRKFRPAPVHAPRRPIPSFQGRPAGLEDWCHRRRYRP